MSNQKIKMHKFGTRLALILLLVIFACAMLAACGDETPPAHTHTPGDPVEENKVASTCSVAGHYDSVVYCTVCHDEISREQKTLPRAEHTPGEPVEESRVNATCTKPGSYKSVVYCTVCKAKISSTTVNTGLHNPDEPVEVERRDATCLDDGYYRTIVYCRDCHEEISRADTLIPASPDKHVAGPALPEDVEESTCLEQGHYYSVVRCYYCSEELSREYQMLPLAECTRGAMQTENFVKQSCKAEGGCDFVWYCTVCEKVLESIHETYPKLSHSPLAPVEENRVEPSCHAEGGYDEVMYCSSCNEVISSKHHTIPIKHTPAAAVRENVEEPVYGYKHTSQDGGYDEVVYCSLCTKELSRTHHTTKITASEYYSKYDYLELSATANTTDNIVTNADGTKILTVKTKGGKSVRLLVEGDIAPLDGGWGCFDESTKVYFLDALPGINFIEYELAAKTDEFMLTGYCSLQQKFSVESVDELFACNGGFLIGGNSIKANSEADHYPDYLCLNGMGTTLQLVSLKIYYCNVMTEVVDIQLNTSLYASAMSNSYLPGDWYDGKIEKGAEEAFNYGYPLNILLDNSESLAGPNKYYMSLIEFGDNVKFGDIIDVNGKTVDKTNRFLQAGDKIEVTIGKCTKYLDLCTEVYTGDTLYKTSTVTNINSVGTQNVLVVPLTFKDQQDRIDDTWMLLLKKTLGNVADADGNVTKYSLSNGELSLSEYLATSSYGKFTANFYISDPYVIDGIGSDYFYGSVPESIYSGIEASLYSQNLVGSRFDQDGNGYYDVVILVNTLVMADGTGSSYGQGSMSGAYEYSLYMGLSNAGTSEKPIINTCFSTAAFHLFGKSDPLSEANVTTHTLIHEFGHTFGLMDYYINGQQQNAIGKFDMEADSAGDWNSYSKYILGWVEPTVVDGTKDSVEINIRSYATYGDVILVRALGYDGTGTPFDEYILIDLFAHDGLYEKDAASYGLSEAVGVRIYHVNSLYDVTTVRSEAQQKYAYPHLSSDFSSKYHSQGKYLLEMVQKGNVNTFMKDFDPDTCTREDILGTIVDADDLFYAGDSFSVDEYDNFFYNGKMDNGMDFGYTITVKEIVENGSESTATIVISKKTK